MYRSALLPAAPISFLVSSVVAFVLLYTLTLRDTGSWAFWLEVAAAWLLAWLCVEQLASVKSMSRVLGTALAIVIPVIFGVWILVLWELLTRGFNVPQVLLPAPSAIAVAGLSAAQPMQHDLMKTYAASYWQSLFKLRIPEALPFIFNALKINSTLAMIGAIVAEFFGTPTVGMGFRISTEVGRMNVDMVWAEIAVAAVAGSLFYGVVVLAERWLTFWHPSIRSSKR